MILLHTLNLQEYNNQVYIIHLSFQLVPHTIVFRGDNLNHVNPPCVNMKPTKPFYGHQLYTGH